MFGFLSTVLKVQPHRFGISELRGCVQNISRLDTTRISSGEIGDGRVPLYEVACGGFRFVGSDARPGAFSFQNIAHPFSHLFFLELIADRTSNDHVLFKTLLVQFPIRRVAFRLMCAPENLELPLKT